MIKNIVFDLGNVLVDFCWREHIAGLGYTGEVARRLGEAMMLSPVWNEIDRGVWTEEEILQGFIKNDPELETEIRHTFSDISTVVKEREYARSWVISLKEAGYQVYYLSNYGEKTKRETEKELQFLKAMDGGVMSYEIQVNKPDAKIYQELFARYGLKPEECVFLDDLPANIAAAKELGMYGIVVKDQEQADAELQELLKKVNG